MSLTLDTRSAPVVDGRCTGCGRFIAVGESHFHSEKRIFRGPPRVHLFAWGEGGLVTRCQNVEWAHILITRRYAKVEYGKWFDQLDDEERLDVLRRFPFVNGEVQRGRVNVTAPTPEGYTWWWMRLDDGARGPGITTAVVWT